MRTLWPSLWRTLHILASRSSFPQALISAEPSNIPFGSLGASCVKMKIKSYRFIVWYAYSADSFPPPARRSYKGAASTVDPTLDRALGTHRCWEDRGSVDSKLTQGFTHMTGAVGIESQTLGSLVQCLNHSATSSIQLRTKMRTQDFSASCKAYCDFIES